MASLKQHEQDCINQLDNPYTHVHRFLDQYAKYFHGYKTHRRILHNKYGLQVVKEKWGEKAYQAALLHIKRDRYGKLFDYLRNP